MKRMLRNLLLVMMIVTTTIGLTGCSSKASKIKDTLEEFEYACHNLDIDAMLKCIDPDVADPIRLGFALISTFTDTDYEDLIDGLFDNIGTSEFGSSFDAEEFLDTIEVSDVDLKTKGSNATVSCKVHFEVAGEGFDRDAEIDMVEKDDTWYIKGIDLFVQDE